LSRRSVTYDNRSFEVVMISLASYFFGELASAFKTVFEKLTIHLSGVNISWVTLEVNMCNSLLSASILASLLTSVTSLKVAT
jgi:hypothetical protein